MTAGGKRRQLAANYQRQKASYCDKFVAAFCRYLPPRFCPGFFLNDFVRGWCLSKNYFHDGLFQRRFMVGVNVCNCRRSWLRIPCQRIRWLPCARIQNPIVCRRSSRQCIARLIRLRSTLHPPPGSGNFAFRISRTRGFSRHFDYLELKAHFLTF